METITRDIKNKMDQANPDKREGRIARTIEEQTSKLPSDVFLWTAIGAMAVSLGFKLWRRDETSMFIGQWAPSLLLFGVYNKLVKQMGHDKYGD